MKAENPLSSCKSKSRLLLFSYSVMYDPLQPHGLQHARLPCPSLAPWVSSNSCPLSLWCYPNISSSVVPFSYALNLSQPQGLTFYQPLCPRAAQPVATPLMGHTMIMLPAMTMPWTPKYEMKSIAAPWRIPSKPNGTNPPKPRGPKLWWEKERWKTWLRWVQPLLLGSSLHTSSHGPQDPNHLDPPAQMSSVPTMFPALCHHHPCITKRTLLT